MLTYKKISMKNMNLSWNSWSRKKNVRNNQKLWQLPVFYKIPLAFAQKKKKKNKSLKWWNGDNTVKDGSQILTRCPGDNNIGRGALGNAMSTNRYT